MNSVVIRGKLASAPENKSLNQHQAVAKVSIIVTEHFEDPSDGKSIAMTQWFQVITYNYLAQYVLNLSAGDKITVEGRLQNQIDQDKNNNSRYATQIIANNISLRLRGD